MVYRQRTVGEQESTEISYFIISHAPKVRALAGHIREHWSIKNSQHHVLDVTFEEDAIRIRQGSAPKCHPPFAACLSTFCNWTRRSKRTSAANASVPAGMSKSSNACGQRFATVEHAIGLAHWWNW